MRVIGNIAHPQCKITLFSWNQKYLLKFELGMCEQTFKIEHAEVQSEDDLRGRLTEHFIQDVLKRFSEMHTSLRDFVD